MSPTDEEIGELAAKLRGEAGASMFKNTRHEAAGYLESLLVRAKAAEASATEAFQIGVRHQDAARKAESDLSSAREEIAALRELVAEALEDDDTGATSLRNNWWDRAVAALRSSRTKGE